MPTLYGDWDRAQFVFTRLREQHKAVVSQIMEENAQMAVDGIQDALEKQTFPGANVPLTPAWKKRKKALGLETKVLIASGDYKSSFEWKKRAWNKYTVGPSASRHDAARMSYRKLAKISEGGTRNQPARPHIWPTIQTLIPKFKANWRTYRARVIGEKQG